MQELVSGKQNREGYEVEGGTEMNGGFELNRKCLNNISYLLWQQEKCQYDLLSSMAMNKLIRVMVTLTLIILTKYFCHNCLSNNGATVQ